MQGDDVEPQWSEADRPLNEVLADSHGFDVLKGFLAVASAIVVILGLAAPSLAQEPSNPSGAPTADSVVVEAPADVPGDGPSITPSVSGVATTVAETVTPSGSVTASGDSTDSVTGSVSEATVSGSSSTLAITSIEPSGVPRSGGGPIVITGTGLSAVTGITLDGTAITEWSVVDDREVRASAPPVATSLSTAILEISSAGASVTWTLEVFDDSPLLEPVDASRGFIVKYRERRAALGALGAVSEELNVPGLELQPGKSAGPQLLVVEPSEPLTPQDAALALEDLRADPRIEWAEPNYRIRPLAFPSTPPDDPYWSTNQWSLWDSYGVGIGSSSLAMDSAWEESQGAGTVVAVLDTGYTVHEDLPSSQLVDGYDFVSSFTPEFGRRTIPGGSVTQIVNVDGDYVDTGAFGAVGRDANPLDSGDWDADPSFWHGTLVAGQIAALTNNAVGVAAAAPQTKVQPIRVLSWDGGDVADLAAAIYWASGQSVGGVPDNATPAQVINLSLGSTTVAACPFTLRTAIQAAVDRGVVVVAAAGNSNTAASEYFPANCPGVIAVGATGQDGERSSYSNYGPTVDLSAPGDGIIGLYNPGSMTPTSGTDEYAIASGTSFSGPLVAAAAALLKSWNPALTPAQVETLLVDNTKSFAGGSCDRGEGCGSGILDISAALAAAAPGTAGTSLSIRGGDGQDAQVGSAVSTPLTVTVVNSVGSPLRDVTVTYAVASGGGSVVGSSVITDTNGTATLGAWTLGPVAGANTLRATISGTGTSVVFTANGTAAPSPPTPAPPSPSPDAPSGGGSTAAPGGGTESGGDATAGPTGSLGPTDAMASVGVGQAVADLAGTRVPVQTVPLRSRFTLEVTGVGFGVSVRATEFGGGSAELSAAGAIRIQPGQGLEISGFGYAPGTVVQVYASRPVRALGSLTVQADGTFEGRLAVPADLVAGSGALQVNGVAASGVVRSVTLGVEVRVPALVKGTKLRTTVYFAAGSRALSPSQEAKLRRLLAQVPRNSDVSVLARGFAPKRIPAGDSPAARARADAVLEYLDSIGLSGQTYASGTGRSATAGKQARKVAVTLTYRELPKVEALEARALS